MENDPMHPTICRFFEERYKGPIEIDKNSFGLRWNAVDYENFTFYFVAYKEHISPNVTYWFKGKWYCEKEMLRIVKLKGFM